MTTLYTFCAQNGCRDGFGPEGALLMDSGQNLYGTTWAGGAYGDYGTIFELSPAGKLKTLYSFCPQSGCPDGDRPSRVLARDSDWDFYGTARYGGAHGKGTLWERTRKGQMITLYSFCSQPLCTDGATPVTVVLASDGSLYGITTYGGSFQLRHFLQNVPGRPTGCPPQFLRSERLHRRRGAYLTDRGHGREFLRFHREGPGSQQWHRVQDHAGWRSYYATNVVPGWGLCGWRHDFRSVAGRAHQWGILWNRRKGREFDQRWDAL